MDQDHTNQDNTQKDAENNTPDNKKSGGGAVTPGDRLLQAEIEEIMASTPPTSDDKKPRPAPQQSPDTKQPPQQEKPTSKQAPAKRTSAIRTYYSDAADVVQDKQVSMTDIALAEQRHRESHDSAKQTPQEKQRKPLSFVLTVLGILVLLGGIGVLGYVYITRDGSMTPTQPTITHTLIPADHEQTIDTTGMTRNAFLAALDEHITETTLPVGDIAALTLLTTPQNIVATTTTRELTSRELLDTLQTDIDAALLRSIEPEYMLGIHNTGDRTPFLVLRTSFFENAFAGMLRWEPIMANDLAFITQSLPAPETVPNGTSTPETAPATTTEPSRQERFTFRDIIVANRDVRALMNNVGDIRLVYSFPDKNTLIITNTTATLEELFTRLTTARFSE